MEDYDDFEEYMEDRMENYIYNIFLMWKDTYGWGITNR